MLGIVGGTATVVNGLKCVGHGRCETACPVAAIEVGLGDLEVAQGHARSSTSWLETTRARACSWPASSAGSLS